MRKVKMDNTNFNINDYLNELRNNHKLVGIDVNINNANSLQLYLDETSHCDICKGLDECPNRNQGYTVKLNKEEVLITSVACKYQRVLLEQKEMKAKFKTLYLPDRILKANFDEFLLNSEGRKKAYKFANNFATNFKRGETNKGLYVCGNFQIGKTYFLASCANLFAQKGIESILIYFPDFVRELKSNIGKPSFDELIENIKNIDVLMLDDLGAELVSAWIRDEILCPILNYRLQMGLPVFVSSNLNPVELEDLYTKVDMKDYNARRLSERIGALSILVKF